MIPEDYDALHQIKTRSAEEAETTRKAMRLLRAEENAKALNGETVPFPEHALSLLALTLAVGGKITIRHGDLSELTAHRLVVTEDVATGDKVYEAVRIRPLQNSTP